MIKFKLSNSGQTPAYDVKTSVIVIPFGDGVVLTHDILNKKPLSAGVFNQVHSGTDVEYQFETKDIDFSVMVKDGKYADKAGINVIY